jgi:putative phosphoesterase
MQKIAVISDIHGNIAALESITADISTRQVDGVINLGDHVSGPLWPKETIQYLMARNWVNILGNHDRQLINQNPKDHGHSDRYAFERLNSTEMDWLRSLPSSMQLQDDFLLIHGAPGSDSTYFLETVERGRTRLATPTEIKKRLGETQARIILCGHTHVPRLVEASENISIINPGSVGLQAYEDQLPEYYVTENGSHHARYAILEYKSGQWNVEFILVPYEYQKAAEQARKNGRLDWEIALQSGYMQSPKTT